MFTFFTVYLLLKNTLDDEGSAISNDILKMPHGTLEMERPMKLFDMKKFQQVLQKEETYYWEGYFERAKLEVMLFSILATLWHNAILEAFISVWYVSSSNSIVSNSIVNLLVTDPPHNTCQ